MMNRPVRMISLTLVAALLPWYGCASPEDAGRGARNDPAPPVAATQADGLVVTHDIAGTSVDARPAAIVNGRSVFWGELRPLLNEAAGAMMLQEVVLDRRLDEAAVLADIVIGPDEIARERRLMLETLHEDPNIAIRLLDEVRSQQGLGRTRFAALLRRNAILRELVRDNVRLTQRDIERTFDAIYGPKRQARLIVLPSLAQARGALARLEAGEAFVDLAVELSTDASAARGGLLEPISRNDPSYPEALRNALWSLEPHAPSSPILLDDQYALLLLVREIDGEDVQIESVRPAVERLARLSQERMRMDQLARNILADARITVFDESLKESWNRMRREQP